MNQEIVDPRLEIMIERNESLEKNVENISNKIEGIYDKIDKMIGCFTDIRLNFQKEKEHTVNIVKERADKTFASKLSEKAVIACIGLILTTIIGAAVGRLLVN